MLQLEIKTYDKVITIDYKESLNSVEILSDIEKFCVITKRNNILVDVHNALMNRNNYSHQYFSIEWLDLTQTKLDVQIIS